jgi:predicted N-acetyltransferase YhbS
VTDHPVIAVHSGSRAELRALFELAEDSAEQLDSYAEQGDVLVARLGDEPVGHLQLVQGDNPGELELKNMAVSEELRGSGIGRRLVLAAIELARSRSAHRLTVATAAADVGNLRVYQRVGFRMAPLDAVSTPLAVRHLIVKCFVQERAASCSSSQAYMRSWVSRRAIG